MNYKNIAPERLLDYLSDRTLSLYCEAVIEFEWCGTVEEESMICFDVDSQNGVYGFTKPYEHNSWGRQYVHKEQIKNVLGHPVMIGDVLEKINEYPYQDSAQNSIDLVQKWGPCKFNKSLNEILCGDIKTEDQLIYAATNYYEPVTFFKNPNTQALFEFLVNTFYDQLR